MSPTKKYLICIVDDHPVVIEGLKSLLTKEQLVTTITFVSGKSFLDFFSKNEVDVVLLDIMLPDINGIDVCREIKEVRPETIVIGISNQAERSIIMQMLQNGANGYLLKNSSSEDLMQCINDCLDGKIGLSEEVKRIMANPSKLLPSLPSISKREKEILNQIANGKTTQDIADELYLSPLTVETHRRNLLQKFDVKNVAELVKVAVKYELI